MRTVFLFSVLLIAGFVAGQFLPFIGESIFPVVVGVNHMLTMLFLAFIMIHIGIEFTIDKGKSREYGWDYVVAATAAGFPWVFCGAYFYYFISDEPLAWDRFREAAVISRFASPTSAGVLFSMLAAAGLGSTWVFKKARVLAIFDDLDTILFMIPLTMVLVGFQWELIIVIVVMAAILLTGWRYFKSVKIHTTWRWILLYAVLITGVCEGIYFATQMADGIFPIQIEVLLPAFVLGCMLAPNLGYPSTEELHNEGRITKFISSLFMFCVGLSMPSFFTPEGASSQGVFIDHMELAKTGAIDAIDWVSTTGQNIVHGGMAGGMGWKMITFHVINITAISNLGKMFPFLCYRKEATLRERLAVSIALFPRGEVGAGVIVISLAHGVEGPMITVAVISLMVNLVMTGLFIAVIKYLLTDPPTRMELPRN